MFLKGPFQAPCRSPHKLVFRGALKPKEVSVFRACSRVFSFRVLDSGFMVRGLGLLA